MILVTGHRGFIGSHLTPRVDGWYGLDITEGRDILNCPLPDASLVIHLAAQPGVIKSMEDPHRTMLVNVQGTVRLCERYRDVPFIFASSGGTIQETIASPYGLSKKMGEDYLRLRHPDAVILRFPNVYGPRSRSVVDRFLQEDALTVYGDGSQTRTFVHVDDLCDAILGAFEWRADTYSLGGETTTVGELAAMTRKRVVHEPWREGELVHSSVPNTAPGWQPTVRLSDYMQAARCAA